MASVFLDRRSQDSLKKKTDTQGQRKRMSGCVCVEGQVVVSLVSNAIYVCAFQTSSSGCGQEKKRKRGKEEQSDGLPSLPRGR